MRIFTMIGLSACSAAPTPELTECEQFFIDVGGALCDGVDKSVVSCDSLACSEATFVFDARCSDPATCCAYQECWGTWESCTAGCSSPDDVDSCVNELGNCVSEKLSK